jgi:short-subunit dehydrogenase
MPTPRRNAILITGASSGIGLEMARQFAAKGYDLALCARRIDKLEQLRLDLLHYGRRIEVQELDVTNHCQVMSAFTELDNKIGGLDRIIVNAGVAGGSKIGTGEFDKNRQVLETNLVSGLAQIEAALNVFRARGHGHIVLISSLSAVAALPGAMAAYGASKAGLSYLGKALSRELADTEISVSTIFPGYIRTPLNAHKGRLPFEVDVASGTVAIVRAIERELRVAYVPSWPWKILGRLLPLIPARLIAGGEKTNT